MIKDRSIKRFRSQRKRGAPALALGVAFIGSVVLAGCVQYSFYGTWEVVDYEGAEVGKMMVGHTYTFNEDGTFINKQGDGYLKGEYDRKGDTICLKFERVESDSAVYAYEKDRNEQEWMNRDKAFTLYLRKK